ncbi:peptidase M48 [Marinomonas agarivorans]|nr:peptidase M48 [Marinomonas agarivorans]
MRKIKQVTTTLLIIGLLSPFSAQTNGEYQLPDFITNLDETSLSNPAYVTGQHWFRKLHGHSGFIHYPPAYEYLRGALSVLLPVTGLNSKKIEIGLLNSSQSNAFVLPGNHLFIYSDILNLIDTEEKLFALLAHELAHLDLRHYERRIKNNSEESGKALALIGAGIAAALSGVDGEASSALFLSGIANKQENMLANSRRHEVEADKQARFYLSQAGLNPDAMKALFLSFFQASVGKTKLEFLSTHPIPDSRFSDSIQGSSKEATVNDSDSFTNFRTIVLTYRAALSNDSKNFLLSKINNKEQQTHALALLALLEGNLQEALKYAQELNENNNAQAYLKAEILLANKKTKAGLATINAKLAILPKSLMFSTLKEQLHPIRYRNYFQQDRLQYEKNLIIQTNIQKAKLEKNRALTFAYQALDEFNKGRKAKALILIEKAKKVATDTEKSEINTIYSTMASINAAEKLYEVDQD